MGRRERYVGCRDLGFWYNSNNNQAGYEGNVHLVSPDGNEVVKINVPGRYYSSRWDGNTRILKLNGNRRQNKRFNRLLSQGWQVLIPEEVAKRGLVDKKLTDLVLGSTKTGDASHGGKHASGEIKNSPNAFQQGKRQRKCRGGQKNRRKQKGENQKRLRIKIQHANQSGNSAVYSPRPLRATPGLLESAEKSAGLLMQLVGRSESKIQRGIRVDALRLLTALEINDNPLPALEAPDERPKLKVLVTPDCSGSTQNWSGLGCAWALHLSQLPDLDIIYLENFNGDFWKVEDSEEVKKLISSVDVVVYLGDGDGRQLCEHYASLGAKIVAFDSYCASWANPRLKTSHAGQGIIHWVDKVSADVPESWYDALKLCVGR